MTRQSKYGFNPEIEMAGKTSQAERQRSALEQARRRSADHARKTVSPGADAWKRQSWTLPRDEARRKAREFLKKYPKAAYWTEVESWRELPGGRIEFTMRRLPSAD